MNAIRLTQLQVHMAGIAMVALIAAAGYFLFIEPALDQRDHIMRQNAENASADRDAVVAEANLRAARRTLETREATLAALSFTLEPASRTNDRMVRLTALAESSDLSVSALEPGKPARDHRHTRVPIRMSGSASFTSLVSFLTALRERFPDTRLDALELADSPTEPATFTLDCTWFAGHAGHAGSDADPSK